MSRTRGRVCNAHGSKHIALAIHDSGAHLGGKRRSAAERGKSSGCSNGFYEHLLFSSVRVCMCCKPLLTLLVPETFPLYRRIGDLGFTLEYKGALITPETYGWDSCCNT